MRLDLNQIQERSVGTLIEHLGVRFTVAEHGRTEAHLVIADHHHAPNGYLHAGAVVTLADTCCGFGALVSLPEDADNFTTIELKTNFLGTARDGLIRCAAQLVHGGRKTQVWDAVVTDGSGRIIAVFRCTQMVLYPKPAREKS